MYPDPTWGGVDWFGCEDDLDWLPRGALADDDPEPGHAPSRSRRRRGRRPAAASNGRPRRILILDVENVCPASRRPVRALARLRAVVEAAGPVDRIVAASAASQHGRLDQLLRAVGVDAHLRVGNRHDAADRALIHAARQFAQDGACEVVVASNDHGFRTIATMPGVQRVIVITVPHLATARALVRVADELRVVAA